MSPEGQARAIKERRLKGLSSPGAPAPKKPSDPPIRVRIVDELGHMSNEQIEQLQDKILELVDAETDGNGPNFVGCTTRLGCLLLKCANDQTIEWLERHLPDFQLWEGAQLKITKSVPKVIIGVAYVQDPDLDEEAILRMLKSQNQGIDFTKWRITGKTLDFPAGQTITFSIDEPSVETLAERNNFVYLGLKKIKIRLKGQRPMGMGRPGPMGMGPTGPIGMGPMGPTGMGPAGPMCMGPVGPMGMAPMKPMGFVPAESTLTAMHAPPRGSSYTPRFQPQHFGGGNQPNNVGGSKNSKKNKRRGGSARNGGHYPNPNNNPYPGKGKSKDRRSQFSGNTNQYQGQKSRKKNKGGPSF